MQRGMTTCHTSCKRRLYRIAGYSPRKAPVRYRSHGEHSKHAQRCSRPASSFRFAHPFQTVSTQLGLHARQQLSWRAWISEVVRAAQCGICRRHCSQYQCRQQQFVLSCVEFYTAHFEHLCSRNETDHSASVRPARHSLASILERVRMLEVSRREHLCAHFAYVWLLCNHGPCLFRAPCQAPEFLHYRLHQDSGKDR